MRIWTYKNADEKAHTFSRRSKNVKKRTKTYEKRILCKFTFNHSCFIAQGRANVLKLILFEEVILNCLKKCERTKRNI